MEYHSEAHAKSAMANLAGKDLNGRKIRVDFANQSSSSGGVIRTRRLAAGRGLRRGRGGGDFVGGSAGGGGGARRANQVPAGPSQHEAVRNALGGLTVYQLYDVLKQMKELCQKKPKDAERILLSKPSLAQALLQAQHMLGMVHTSPAGLDLPTDPSVQLPGSGGGASTLGCLGGTIFLQCFCEAPSAPAGASFVALCLHKMGCAIYPSSSHLASHLSYYLHKTRSCLLLVPWRGQTTGPMTAAGEARQRHARLPRRSSAFLLDRHRPARG